MSSFLKICLIAGEASGDSLGASLMSALKERAENISFCGVGGSQMDAEGLESLFPMEDLSVMGLTEVLPRLPLLIHRINQTADHIIETVPDIVVTIDSPDFSFRVAKRVRQRCPNPPKLIHYVAPTVWAWRPERARKVAALYDGILCLFPFEPPYFEREGMRAAFVGHSVIENFEPSSEHSSADKVLGVFFGSRMGELNRTGPVLREAALQIVEQNPGISLISPTLQHLEKQVRNLLVDFPCDIKILTDPVEKKRSFQGMSAALATSGTVGLELAVAGVPHVIGYKMNALTWQVVKRKVTVPYAHLANILLDSPVVPEFIQHECRPAEIGEAVNALLKGGAMLSAQRESFAKVRTLLTGEKDQTPAEQAAGFVLNSVT